MAKAIAMALVIVVTIEATSGIRDKHVTSNVTQTLDFLLASNRYDKRLRPGFGGSPITISVNFFVKSIGPVSDNDQSFALDCYFRQHWYDLRLRYQKLPGLEEFSMSWLFLDRVWKPDTYFVNGKRSFLHRITVPNKFLRLRHDGYITYSMRLTITASCPMYLKKFPLDTQRCPLILGSYGYSNKDLVYKWTETAAIGLQEGVEIAQFDLSNITTEDEKIMIKGGLSYSTVQATFWLKRHTGYFMLQVYIPCGLIVVASWISFWIDPDAVPARVTLGVTTVLSLTTMGFGGRAQLPKVSYWTALDWFVIICFTSVFSVMIEYAIVNFIDKFTKDIKKMIASSKKEEEEKLKKSKIQKEKSETQDEKQIKKKKRSKSFSFSPSKPEDQTETETTVQIETKPSTILKEIPKKLSTTVVAYFTSAQSQKRSKSIPNINLESGKYEADKSETPQIVVTNFDRDLIDLETEVEPIEVILNMEEEEDAGGREDTQWGGRDEKEKKKMFVNLLTRIKRPKEWWENVKILPEQAAIMNLIPEPPNKFSKIDVQSRRNFPIAFCISLFIYLLAFMYYLTDDFPARNSDIVLYKQ